MSGGVTEGTRTPDIQDHNLALYQLSYGHHAVGQFGTGSDGGPTGIAAHLP